MELRGRCAHRDNGMVPGHPKMGNIAHHFRETLLILQRQRQEESESVKLFFSQRNTHFSVHGGIN